MTMPDERYRAIVKTERFLIELLCDESLSRELRDKAYSCLRHYPTSPLLDLLSDAAPDILQPGVMCQQGEQRIAW